MADENDSCPCGSAKRFKDCHLHDPAFALAVGVDTEMNEAGARCIRRALFITGWDGYEISGAGTCFLVKFQDALWIVTAKHVMGGIDGRKLVVSPSIPREGTAPLDETFTLLGSVAPEADNYSPSDPSFDLTLLLTDQTDHPDAFDLTALESVAPLNVVAPGARLKAFGFPGRLANGIDHASGAIYAQAQYAGGRYDGPSPIRHQHVMTSDFASKVTPGMSGGPVFMLQDGAVVLAGVTTHMDTLNPNRAYFIDARWIPTLAEEHHARIAVPNTIGKAIS